MRSGVIGHAPDISVVIVELPQEFKRFDIEPQTVCRSLTKHPHPDRMLAVDISLADHEDNLHPQATQVDDQETANYPGRLSVTHATIE